MCKFTTVQVTSVQVTSLQFFPYGHGPNLPHLVEIVNINATFKLGQSFTKEQYHHILQHVPNAEMESKKHFPHLMVRIYQPNSIQANIHTPKHRVTATIYRSGHVLLAGMKTLQEVPEIARQLVTHINTAFSVDTNYLIRCRVIDLYTTNLVSALKLPYRIRLAQLHDDIQTRVYSTYYLYSEYEVTNFSGLKTRIYNPGGQRPLSVNMWTNGKAMIFGATNLTEVEACARFLRRLTNNYKIQ